ncbi:MAG: ATP phosphoribosyltransferase [Cellulosilyticaceae bacterium]
MNQITFALAKGRLALHTMQVLKAMGITCSEMEVNNRKLLYVSDDGRYRFFLSKASDVPTYVDYGVADIGVVGKDTILEEKRSVYEMLDLGFGKCQMVVAGPESARKQFESGRFLRVATKYPVIAQQYFAKSNRSVELIKLHGSVELGPIVGLSDVIVDIVESGATLKANGLVVFDELMPLSARCIVNTASMKVKHEVIEQILVKLEDALKEGIK